MKTSESFQELLATLASRYPNSTGYLGAFGSDLSLRIDPWYIKDDREIRCHLYTNLGNHIGTFVWDLSLYESYVSGHVAGDSAYTHGIHFIPCREYFKEVQ